VTDQTHTRQAPGRGAVWVRALLPAIVIVAVGWTGLVITYAFGGPTGWQNLVYVSAALLWIVPIVLSRSVSVAVFGVFAAGIYLIITLFSGSATVQAVALTGRGQDVPAVLVSEDRAAICHSCGVTAGTFEFPFRATDGSGRQGVLIGTRGTHYRVGDHVTVVVDPSGHVDPVDRTQLHLVRNVIFSIVGLLLALAQCYFGAAAWRARRQAARP
jgi:hypothetical protein